MTVNENLSAKALKKMHNMMLEGKKALITGGSKGIGKSIVEQFAAYGAEVGFTYLSSPEKAEAIVDDLKAKGYKVVAYKSDASDFEQSEKLIADFTAEFGALDILINNAGITQDNLIMRMSEDQFDKVIGVNLKSVFNLTKAATRTFMKQRSGSIVNLSSVVGVRGNAGQSNYAASKAGIIGFTKSIALELGSRNIRANVIAPGFIATEMTDTLDEKVVQGWLEGIPLKRVGEPKEIADLAAFLGSDQSKYITGQVIEINGGMNT
jgi:3-oxoacyl-[acyl-carrier protein] reductase